MSLPAHLVPVNTPKYRRIHHTPHFHEMFLADFSRTTLDMLGRDIEMLYAADGKTAPYLRTLMDFSVAFALTPYAIQTFRSIAQGKTYATNDIRVALLVKNSVFMQLITEVVRGIAAVSPNLRFRFFTRREDAVRWLWEGVPTEHQPQTKSSAEQEQPHG